MALTPSVWRTCRVLANPLRLACLRAVVRNPEAVVQDVARAAGVPTSLASQYLRQLQARGLLAARRDSRWVHYAAMSDDSVVHAGRILTAVRAALQAQKPPFSRTRQTLTGFTHPRRLAILSVIVARPGADADALRAVTGISRQALARHLDKLRRHGILAEADGCWRVVPSPDPLAAALLLCLRP
jgi:DNA-binding transcriptional ArsR family regulator